MSQLNILRCLVLLSLYCVHAQQNDNNVKTSWEWELEGQYRYFYDSPQFEHQINDYPSLSVEPTFRMSWNDGYEKINATVFLNWDKDPLRTYWDLREVYYQKAKNNWEINVGLKKIFWGVTESAHLVDIINQSDQLKSFDGEEKLGQPMVQFSWFTSNVGTFDFFYLPYHRKRAFPGSKGRFRFSTVINADDIHYKSSNQQWNPDFALRWKHYIGAFDLGLSYFKGNGREPYFEFDDNGNIMAYYPLIDQYGLDLQITSGALLWKLETLYRTAQQQNFYASVVGFEYTFSNIDKQGLDIGLIGEYLYDDRDEKALNGMQNDIFYGMRIAFNDISDTSFLAGAIYDMDTATQLYSVEGSRRFANSVVVTLEGRIFSGVSDKERFLSYFKQDSFFSISLSKYF